MATMIEVHPGDRFGRLVVVRELDRLVCSGRPFRVFLCRCSCGEESKARLDQLRQGRKRSCGCLRREEAAARSAIDKVRHGFRSHYLYVTWNNARNRIANPQDPSYKNYGGRGITMLTEWIDNPTGFIRYVEEHLGPRPAGMTIDRINNDKGYEPGNLRWATRSEQRRNQRPRTQLARETKP